MTADVIVLPVRELRSPEDTVAGAHRLLHATLAVADKWVASDIVGCACAVLDGALDVFTAIRSGAVHWEAFYPHLAGEADPHAEALERAAEETDALARALLLAIAVACGTELADAIKDTAADGGTRGDGE